MMATFSNEYQVCFLRFLKHFQGNSLYVYYKYILSNNDKVHEDETAQSIKTTIYNKLCSKFNIALEVYVHSQLKCMCFINVYLFVQMQKIY